MRQLDADLRRFFARRIVRGAFLLVAVIMLLVISIQSIRGHAPSAAGQARYQQQVAQRDATPSTVLPDGTIVTHGGPLIVPVQPVDTRVRVHDRLPSGMEGVGVALLFIAFVLGASFIGAEYNVGSLTTQLLYEPRRLRVHAGKTVAVAIGMAAFAAATLALLAASMYTGAALHGVTTGVDATWWWQRLGEGLRIIGAVTMAGAMAYGVTLVARRSAAGIIIFFLQYPLLFLIRPDKAFGFISHYMPLRGLLAIVLHPTLDQDPNLRTIHTIMGGTALTLVWLAIILAVSGRIFSRSEVR